MKRQLITAILIVAVAACGSDSELPSADPDDTATSEEDATGNGKGKDGNHRPGERDGKRSGAQDDDPGDAGDDSGSEDDPASDGGDDPPDDGDDPGSSGSNDPAVREGRSVVSEPTPDAQEEGTAPEYAEIIESSITGLGGTFRMQMTMNADLPDRMPTPTTYMVVHFGIKREDDYNFFVMGRSTGWKAYTGDKNDPEEFPGRFEIDGNVILLETSWAEIDGARPFRWSSSATWVQNMAGVSNFSTDRAPNGKKRARYPE